MTVIESLPVASVATSREIRLDKVDAAAVTTTTVWSQRCRQRRHSILRRTIVANGCRHNILGQYRTHCMDVDAVDWVYLYRNLLAEPSSTRSNLGSYPGCARVCSLCYVI